MEERVPEISDRRLAELLERLVPITVDGQERASFIQMPHPRTEAYLWSPDPSGPVPGLRVLVRFRTFHAYGAPSLFKPSIAEVLAQLPAELPPEARAFTTFPETAELSERGDLHVAQSALFAFSAPVPAPARHSDLARALCGRGIAPAKSDCS